MAALLGYLAIFIVFLELYGSIPKAPLQPPPKAVRRDLRDFILIGEGFIKRSDTSSIIAYDPTYDYYDVGYDGQFSYFIALDPANARYYIDNPGYRYSRILYPVAARLLALGNPDWVPFSLVLVNLLAVTAGTWAIAAWCVRRGLSPWLALVYAFYIGQAIAFVRDLNEILAYSLVAVAIYIFDRWERYRLLAGAIFGLAALARETTLVFPALYALYLLLNNDDAREWRERLLRAGLFAAAAFGPLVLWVAYLQWWLGSSGLGLRAGIIQAVPFAGLYHLYPIPRDGIDEIEPVIVPAAICLAVSIFYLWRLRGVRRRPEVWGLLLNALLFVALAPDASLVEIYSSARIAIPVVMSATYALAFLPGKVWFYICSGLWLAATVAYLMNPVLGLLQVEG